MVQDSNRVVLPSKMAVSWNASSIGKTVGVEERRVEEVGVVAVELVDDDSVCGRGTGLWPVSCAWAGNAAQINAQPRAIQARPVLPLITFENQRRIGATKAKAVRHYRVEAFVVLTLAD